MNTALIAVRFVHFACAMVLFGGGVFRLGLRRHLPDADFTATDAYLRRVFIAAAALALISGVGWLWLAAAEMADHVMMDLDWGILREVVFGAWFSTNWLWRMAVGVVLFIAALRGRAVSVEMTMGAALVFLAGIAVTGHAGAAGGFSGGIARAIDAAHLLGAGTWIGALVVLVPALRERPHDAGEIVYRFSNLAVVAVIVIVAAGIGNTAFVLPLVEALWSTRYGWVLLAKVALALVMVLFAVFNRLVLTPRVSEARARATLLRNARVEIALGALVVAMAAWLGTLPPPSMAM